MTYLCRRVVDAYAGKPGRQRHPATAAAQRVMANNDQAGFMSASRFFFQHFANKNNRFLGQSPLAPLPTQKGTARFIICVIIFATTVRLILH